VGPILAKARRFGDPYFLICRATSRLVR
jgi:hypothetical protein